MGVKLEFYALLDLQRQLRFVGYDKLNLSHLDELRGEVDRRVEQIIMKHKAGRIGGKL